MDKMIEFIANVVLVGFIVFIILLLGLVVISYLGEKPPEHTLDFQDINETVLRNPIHSIEDGLPYALDWAHTNTGTLLDKLPHGFQISARGMI